MPNNEKVLKLLKELNFTRIPDKDAYALGLQGFLYVSGLAVERGEKATRAEAIENLERMRSGFNFEINRMINQFRTL